MANSELDFLKQLNLDNHNVKVNKSDKERSDMQVKNDFENQIANTSNYDELINIKKELEKSELSKLLKKEVLDKLNEKIELFKPETKKLNKKHLLNDPIMGKNKKDQKESQKDVQESKETETKEEKPKKDEGKLKQNNKPELKQSKGSNDSKKENSEITEEKNNQKSEEPKDPSPKDSKEIKETQSEVKKKDIDTDSLKEEKVVKNSKTLFLELKEAIANDMNLKSLKDRLSLIEESSTLDNHHKEDLIKISNNKIQNVSILFGGNLKQTTAKEKEETKTEEETQKDVKDVDSAEIDDVKPAIEEIDKSKAIDDTSDENIDKEDQNSDSESNQNTEDIVSEKDKPKDKKMNRLEYLMMLKKQKEQDEKESSLDDNNDDKEDVIEEKTKRDDEELSKDKESKKTDDIDNEDKIDDIKDEDIKEGNVGVDPIKLDDQNRKPIKPKKPNIQNDIKKPSSNPPILPGMILPTKTKKDNTLSKESSKTKPQEDDVSNEDKNSKVDENKDIKNNILDQLNTRKPSRESSTANESNIAAPSNLLNILDPTGKEGLSSSTEDKKSVDMGISPSINRDGNVLKKIKESGSSELTLDDLYEKEIADKKKVEREIQIRKKTLKRLGRSSNDPKNKKSHGDGFLPFGKMYADEVEDEEKNLLISKEDIDKIFDDKDTLYSNLEGRKQPKNVRVRDDSITDQDVEERKSYEIYLNYNDGESNYDGYYEDVLPLDHDLDKSKSTLIKLILLTATILGFVGFLIFLFIKYVILL